MSTASLKGASDFFSSTWKHRFELGGDINKGNAANALSKILGESKAQRRADTEKTVRKELLSSMAQLSTRKIEARDKTFDKEVAPILRSMGKLIAQKDQAKFFKGLEDFKKQMTALDRNGQAAAAVKDVKASLDFERAEDALEDIAKEEKESFFRDTALGKDLKKSLFNMLGPAGILLNTVDDLRESYGKNASSMLDKVRMYAAKKNDVAEGYADKSRKRWLRFETYSNMLKKGLDKTAVSAFMSKLKSKGFDLAKAAGKFLFSRKGVVLGAAVTGIGRSLWHATGHGSSGRGDDVQAAPVPADTTPEPTGGNAQGLPQEVIDSAQKAEAKKAADEGAEKIADAGGGLAEFFEDKWNSLTKWISGTPIGEQFNKEVTGIEESKGSVLDLMGKLFMAPMRMLGSAFRTIYNILPKPVQKGIDYALKIGGAPVKFFVKLLTGDSSGGADEATQKAGGAQAQSVPQVDGASQSAPGAAAPSGEPPKQGQYPGLKLQQKANVEGLNPESKSKLLAMAAEYFGMTGKTLQINTAKRDYAEQVALYTDGKHNAAKPGTSMHEYGYAIDMNSADANALASMGLLQKYGFCRPVKGEPWHLEPDSIQSRKSEIRKQPPPGAPGSAASATPGAPLSPTGGAGKDIKQATANAAPLTEGGFGPGPTGKGKPKGGGGEGGEGGIMPPMGTGSATPQESTYDRVPSKGRRLNQTISEDEIRGGPAETTMATKESLGSMSFYIGDFDFLSLNFGM